MDVSDLDVNSGIRRVMARHWIDLTLIRFRSSRGCVRVAGTLHHLDGNARQSFERSLVETLEHEIRRIRGVRQVYFELSNWQRDAQGEWVETAATTGRGVEELNPAHGASFTVKADRISEDGEASGASA